MTKIRTVKPELFRHDALFEAEKNFQLPLRLAFIGLFTCCDKEGRFKWEPRSLKLDILPYDTVDFALVLNALWETGFIQKYSWQNKHYGFIPSWHQHQSINKHEPDSKLPDPEQYIPEPCPNVRNSTTLPASTSVAHAPLSHRHMAAQPSEEVTPAMTDIKPVTSVPLCAILTSLSAKHEPVSAGLATEQATASGNDANTAQPISAIEPVPQRVHMATVQADAVEIPVMHIPLSDKHMQTHALHEAVHATHNDLSAMHVPASVEVEVEMEMEREMEVEVEQEVEREKSWGVKRNLVASTRRGSATTAQISTVFNHWKATLQHPQAILDKKRLKLIQQALRQGYTVTQLCHAISGCAQTPHNLGDNDRGQRYDGLHVILRDADQIERFIRNYHRPPRPANAADQLLQANIAAGKNWLQRKQTEADADEKP